MNGSQWIAFISLVFAYFFGAYMMKSQTMFEAGCFILLTIFPFIIRNQMIYEAQKKNR